MPFPALSCTELRNLEANYLIIELSGGEESGRILNAISIYMSV
jgi:hypothetical protein